MIPRPGRRGGNDVTTAAAASMNTTTARCSNILYVVQVFRAAIGGPS